jgi:hypothetical protein
MRGAAEVHHAAAVVADLEQKLRMIFAQATLNVVVRARGVIAYVGGVG